MAAAANALPRRSRSLSLPRSHTCRRTGAPPGAELVQCEIKWVIKILRELRRDCIPFNVPVENI